MSIAEILIMMNFRDFLHEQTQYHTNLCADIETLEFAARKFMISFRDVTLFKH